MCGVRVEGSKRPAHASTGCSTPDPRDAPDQELATSSRLSHPPRLSIFGVLATRADMSCSNSFCCCGKRPSRASRATSSDDLGGGKPGVEGVASVSPSVPAHAMSDLASICIDVLWESDAFSGVCTPCEGYVPSEADALPIASPFPALCSGIPSHHCTLPIPRPATSAPPIMASLSAPLRPSDVVLLAKSLWLCWPSPLLPNEGDTGLGISPLASTSRSLVTISAATRLLRPVTSMLGRAPPPKDGRAKLLNDGRAPPPKDGRGSRDMDGRAAASRSASSAVSSSS